MSEEKKNLAQFLNRLSEDASLQSAMASDPDGTMAASGVAGAEADVMRSRDIAQVHAHLGDFAPEGSILPPHW